MPQVIPALVADRSGCPNSRLGSDELIHKTFALEHTTGAPIGDGSQPSEEEGHVHRNDCRVVIGEDGVGIAEYLDPDSWRKNDETDGTNEASYAADELRAELATLKAQANSPKPKWEIIKATARSIKTVAEGAAGGLIAGLAQPHMATLLALAG